MENSEEEGRCSMPDSGIGDSNNESTTSHKPSMRHSTWQVSRCHEWFLPETECQDKLDGRESPSIACTVISAEVAAAALRYGICLPSSADAPPLELRSRLLRAIKLGNNRYDASNCVGLLGIDQLLESFPDLGIEIMPKLDLGFFNEDHMKKRLPGFITPAAALMIQMPYTVAVCFDREQMVVFDSHAQGADGGSISVSSRGLSTELMAAYLAQFMNRQHGLRNRAMGCQLTFLKLTALQYSTGAAESATSPLLLFLETDRHE